MNKKHWWFYLIVGIWLVIGYKLVAFHPHNFYYTLLVDDPPHGWRIIESNRQRCLENLFVLGRALEMYAQDHQGCLPPSRGPWDYYYWMRGLSPEYLNGLDTFAYGSEEDKNNPSSFVSDPALGGRKLADLKKMGGVVLLKEREFNHNSLENRSFIAHFYILGPGQSSYSQGQVPAGLKFDPHLPPVHHYRLLKILPDKFIPYVYYWLAGFGLLLWWLLGIRKRNTEESWGFIWAWRS